MKLSFLADQLGSPVGGGRFTTDFLSTLLTNSSLMQYVEQLFIIRTQNELIDSIDGLSSKTKIVTRRFPARLRNSLFASGIGLSCPSADVAHGPFFYVLPFQANASLITVHDVSFRIDGFFPRAEQRKKLDFFKSISKHCDAIVCSSDASFNELLTLSPELERKTFRIYCGVRPIVIAKPAVSLNIKRRQMILVVGTIEPRKNYERILDAYEQILKDRDAEIPELVIIGRQGWMCEQIVKRLNSLQASGQIKWLNGASDAQLMFYYQNADVFSYLSLYEGFGYPPFEAAFADVPMVLSNISAVGEIWRDYACCVNPYSVEEIVSAWKWALNLSSDAKKMVATKQRQRAEEFSWSKCVAEYLNLYSYLIAR